MYFFSVLHVGEYFFKKFMLQCFFLIVGIFFTGIKVSPGIFRVAEYNKICCICIISSYNSSMMRIHPYTKLFFVFLSHNIYLEKMVAKTVPRINDRLSYRHTFKNLKKSRLVSFPQMFIGYFY